jgi:hypothetical protein
MLHAYLIFNMPRMKRPPPLSKLQIKLKGRGKSRQTEAQQIATARMWSALGYGKMGKHNGSR